MASPGRWEKCSAAASAALFIGSYQAGHVTAAWRAISNARSQLTSRPRLIIRSRADRSHETTIPASMASIHAIASLHALVTLDLLTHGTDWSPGFSSLLLTLQRVPDVFEEPYRPFKFRIARLDNCLICRPPAEVKSEDLDGALEHA